MVKNVIEFALEHAARNVSTDFFLCVTISLFPFPRTIHWTRPVAQMPTLEARQLS